ncbi:MAG: hypothetical protein U5L72_18030 [Bacteroidales bacterium]|nr:hypothetical protein [Bacteroidales bacterium]
MLDDGGVEEYARILPMEYQYSFIGINDLEEEGKKGSVPEISYLIRIGSRLSFS